MCDGRIGTKKSRRRLNKEIVFATTVNGKPDHVHLLFRAEPTTDLTVFINHLKGLSSRRLREEFDGLKRGLSALWQPGYFLCTTGQVTLADLQEYVENQ